MDPTGAARRLLLLCTLVLAVALADRGVRAHTLGPRLDRQYTGYVAQPTTTDAARAAGWHPVTNATCDDQVGTPWLYNEVRPGEFDRRHPVMLFFSAAGQISAISVAVMAPEESARSLPPWMEAMISLGYLSELPQPDVFAITLGTRASSSLCDPETAFPESIGTTLIINPDDLGQPVPLNHSAARDAGFHRGSCFNGMGWHWMKDLSAAPGEMSWQARSLMPVVPMYNPVDGVINAVFFASAVVQQQILPPDSNEWEPVPLPNPLMCANFCDKACTFNGTSAWSTMHFYFHDHDEPSLKCTESPEVKSCPLGVACCAD
jgi:hypothetical protein